MASRKGINIYGHYVRCIDKCYISFYIICTLYSKKLKGRAESYFILFLELNDHPAWCFYFGYVEFIPMAVSSNFFFFKIKSNTKPF